MTCFIEVARTAPAAPAGRETSGAGGGRFPAVTR